MPWCVVYQRVDDLCRHPATLYDAAVLVVFFAIMVYLARTHFSKKAGNLTYAFMIIYGITRFSVDFFREHGIYVFGISHTQVISILMLVAGIWLLRNQSKKY